MAQQGMGFVLRDHTDAPNAGIDAIGQSKVNDPKFSPKVNRWFGSIVG